MRTCVDVVIDDEVGRVEVLDDKVPPLLPSDELAPPRLSDHLGQLPEWKVGHVKVYMTCSKAEIVLHSPPPFLVDPRATKAEGTGLRSAILL